MPRSTWYAGRSGRSGLLPGLIGAAVGLLVVAVAGAVGLSLSGPGRSAGEPGGGDPGLGVAAPQFLSSARVGNRLIDSLAGLAGAAFRPVPVGQGHTGPMTLAGESRVFAYPTEARSVLVNDGFTGGYRRAWVLAGQGGPRQDRAVVVSGYAFATPAGATDWVQVLLLGASQEAPVGFAVGGLPRAVGYRVRESATVHDEVVMLQVGRLDFLVVESWPTPGAPTVEILTLARAQLARAGAG